MIVLFKIDMVLVVPFIVRMTGSWTLGLCLGDDMWSIDDWRSKLIQTDTGKKTAGIWGCPRHQLWRVKIATLSYLLSLASIIHEILENNRMHIDSATHEKTPGNFFNVFNEIERPCWNASHTRRLYVEGMMPGFTPPNSQLVLLHSSIDRWRDGGVHGYCQPRVAKVSGRT